MQTSLEVENLTKKPLRILPNMRPSKILDSGAGACWPQLHQPVSISVYAASLAGSSIEVGQFELSALPAQESIYLHAQREKAVDGAHAKDVVVVYYYQLSLNQLTPFATLSAGCWDSIDKHSSGKPLATH